MREGAYLTGVGALIRGMPELLEDILKLPVRVADDPLTAVVRGTGIILENLEKYQDILITGADEGILVTA